MPTRVPSLLPWLILLIGLLVTLGIWQISNGDIASRTQERFDARAAQIVTAVEVRMHAYEQVLRGGVGLFRTAGIITRQQWHDYVDNANLAVNYPGIQNMAVDLPIPAAEKFAHVAGIRAEGHTDYSIRPEQPERPVYHSLVYVEPFGGRNLRAFGFDMYTNEPRRKAMNRAIDLGLPSMSGIVTLAQETNEDLQHGFIYCLPVYRSDSALDSPEHRRANLRALVCGAFRAKDLMRGIFGSSNSDLELEIFDEAIAPLSQLYDSRYGDEAIAGEFSRTTPVEIGGRTWLLRVSANQDYFASISFTQSRLVAGTGVMFSFLLFLGVSFGLKKHDRELMRKNSQIFQAIQDSVKESLLVLDKEGIVLSVNPTGASRFALTTDQLVGRNLFDLDPSEVAASRRSHIKEVMGSGLPMTFEDSREGRDYLNSFYPVFDQHKQCEAVVVFAADITERKATAEEIYSLAFYDPLTNLPNRRLMQDRLMQRLKTSTRDNHHGALMLIDIDHFKILNDTLGHDVGDQLLVEVAQRLRSCIRESDTVARLGGDEFVVILDDLDEGSLAATQAEAVAEKIQALLVLPFVLNVIANDVEQIQHSYHCTSSIGITLFHDQSNSIKELMRRADTAMYQAKAAGRNTVRFFDPDMQAVVTARAALETDLRKAISDNQFVLHYQPQVDFQGQVIGAEALIRWQHPHRSMVSPAEFIPLAEDTGLILPIGHWVLTTACAQLAIWATHPETAHFTLAVNVSARQINLPNFVEEVLAVVDAAGVAPGKLKLELTESLLLENAEVIIGKMVALKARGVGFSLDDFGTGYSSLSYLKRLPLDQLKIDRSFVRDVLTDTNDAAIARTIVALGKTLGLAVIAEGVEAEAQRDFLASNGCYAYQGYFFSRPLPLDGFEAFLKQRERSPEGNA
jgi:diguanylate cyclase (GGDEF)-like protein/PAS domain S-box-containing protein